jgi:CheY-like chemotaxis protein
MITALGQLTSLEHLASVGISAFLVKPFYPEQLEIILKLLQDARQKGEKLDILTRHAVVRLLPSSGAVKATDRTSFPGKHVLVVEDMKVNLMLLVKVLEKMGCTVDGAINGVEAVSMLRESRYDAVFMDCQMPEMDGFEATRRIREEEKPENRHTVIIALTADAMTGDRDKCLKAGMDDYLNKPFKPEQIAFVLSKWSAVTRW